MKSFVVDASVTIKWIFPGRAGEDYLPQAINLLRAIKQGAIKILQPLHWLIETTAVVVRLQPKIAIETVNLMHAMEFPIVDTPEITCLASELSERYNHHLFDTLYHAVALYSGNTQLITADEQYYKKAFKEGSIIRLADFSIFND